MLYAIREYASTKSYALAVVAQRVDIGVSCTQAQKNFNKDHDAGANYQVQVNPSFNVSSNTYTEDWSVSLDLIEAFLARP